jgi:membrane fusion protein (multidrug efflux system)
VEATVSLPPPLVEVAEVIQKDVPVYSEWIGTLDGLVNATMRAQAPGYLIKQCYKEGDFVRKGQVLFEIDPRTYEATLNQTKGVLVQARAGLEQARADVVQQTARWETAKANLNRVRPLAARNALSQKTLDDSIGEERSTRAALEAAKAAVGVAQAKVIAAQANVDKAAVDLSFTKVISPIDGIAGMANAQIGNLVGPEFVGELTTISKIDPIKVYVQISEQEYLSTARQTEEYQSPMSIRLILADGSVYPHQGEVAFTDRQVDVATGTIKVPTLFPNPDNILRPGGYARLRMEKEVRKGALLVPQRAVSELRGRYQTAVVDAEQTVSIRNVKVGERVDALWLIEDGLKPGEMVIVEGAVRPGMRVDPKPWMAEGAATE